MYGYVYLTTNLINGKQYVGQHRSGYFTENYKGSGKILKRAFDKYGWSNFKVELLEECNSQDELDQCEIMWIEIFDAVNSSQFYNLAPGGLGGAFILAQEAARKPEVRKKAAVKIMETRRNKYGGDATPWYRKPEVIAKRVQTRKERYGDAAFALHTEESQRKAKQSRIDKYGSSNACMMTPEVREVVSRKVSCILSFDYKEFIGYKSLRDYIKEVYNDDISLTALRRLSRGSYVEKYKNYVGKISIIKYGAVMSNKLIKYDGDIPTAED